MSDAVQKKAPAAVYDRGTCKGGGNHDLSVPQDGVDVNCISGKPLGFCDEYGRLRVALYARAGDEEVLACQVHFAVCEQCRSWVKWLVDHAGPMPVWEETDENEV